MGKYHIFVFTYVQSTKVDFSLFGVSMATPGQRGGFYGQRGGFDGQPLVGHRNPLVGRGWPSKPQKGKAFTSYKSYLY
jgi:hypothetical protein